MQREEGGGGETASKLPRLTVRLKVMSNEKEQTSARYWSRRSFTCLVIRVGRRLVLNIFPFGIGTYQAYNPINPSARTSVHFSYLFLWIRLEMEMKMRMGADEMSVLSRRCIVSGLDPERQ
jgi:hypothetical protein